MTSQRLIGTAGLLALGLAGTAQAALVDVTISVLNRAPANSISFAPLNVGFHDGTYDAFNAGQPAAQAIVNVAEGGDGSLWKANLASAQPGAVSGTIGGLLQPGQAATSSTFRVDTAALPFFSFAAMAVPSNDFFIGNDSPTAYALFDASGNLLINRIDVQAGQIWDAGSEQFSIANAAFIAGSNGAARTPQNGVVANNFAEFTNYNGLTTAAGYAFSSQLNALTDVYRIDLSVAAVPEPSSYALMLGGLLGLAALKRKRRQEA